MRQIYSRAKEVISWVPCRSGDAVEYLIKNRFYGKGCLTIGRARKQTKDDPVTIDVMSLDEYKNRKRWVADGWEIIEDFFSQPYWKRVWVIQEVTVATKAKILCGTYEIPWDDVTTVLSMWKENPESVPLDRRAYLKSMHLVEFRNRFQVKREPISLLDAMRWSYQTEATDPRDKIFALLGLCHDGVTYVPVPNYKQPLKDIIADMSREMMSYDRSLDLMCLKGRTSLQEEGNLPSWMPNWVNLWSGSLHSMTLHEAQYADWHTTFPFNPILEGSTNKILQVDGLAFGIIKHLTSEMAKVGPNGQITLTPQTQAPWTSTASSAASKAEIEDRDSLWKTLTMGLLPQEISEKVAAKCFAKLWTPEGRGAVRNYGLIEWIDRNSWFEYGSRNLGEWSQMGPPPPPTLTSPTTRWKSLMAGASPETSPHQSQAEIPRSRGKGDEDVVQKLDAFIKTIEKVLGSGMRLAVIANIRDELAMVPPDTKENDQVWLIKGCSCPIALRGMGHEGLLSYKVVGGIYLTDALKEKFAACERWARGEGEEYNWDPAVLYLF
jgi:hypothetical protein